MKLITILNLFAVAIVAALFAGCASNKQQMAESTSGDGVLAKAAVPLGTSVGSIGLSLFVGRFNNTAAINPTSTTNLYAASIGAVVGGAGKQALTGTAGTNNGAGITDGSRDGSLFIMGDTSGSLAGGTNAAATVSGSR